MAPRYGRSDNEEIWCCRAIVAQESKLFVDTDIVRNRRRRQISRAIQRDEKPKKRSKRNHPTGK
jgi:hypothetical protein